MNEIRKQRLWGFALSEGKNTGLTVVIASAAVAASTLVSCGLWGLYKLYSYYKELTAEELLEQKTIQAGQPHLRAVPDPPPVEVREGAERAHPRVL